MKKDPFNEIRESTKLIAVAEYYGLQPNRQRFVNCIHHSPDNHPSMQFLKNDKYYRCYSCGAWGDATALVAKLYDISAIAAAKRIVIDFNLNIDFSDDDYSIAVRYESEKVLNGLKVWSDRKYSEYEKNLTDFLEYLKTYEPTEEELESWGSASVAKINELSRQMNVLKGSSVRAKLELYRQLRGDGNDTRR
ncbi:MAG: hypothetical protein KJ774_03230 [Firmicutes bacterium]|nr:hypothetical protein [Bacillota bacterium]